MILSIWSPHPIVINMISSINWMILHITRNDQHNILKQYWRSQYWDILKLRIHYDQYLKPMVVDSQYNLLGGLEHFSIFPYIGNNHPNWLSYFFRGVGQPPTRLSLTIITHIITIYYPYINRILTIFEQQLRWKASWRRRTRRAAATFPTRPPFYFVVVPTKDLLGVFNQK